MKKKLYEKIKIKSINLSNGSFLFLPLGIDNCVRLSDYKGKESEKYTIARIQENIYFLPKGNKEFIGFSNNLMSYELKRIIDSEDPVSDFKNILISLGGIDKNYAIFRLYTDKDKDEAMKKLDKIFKDQNSFETGTVTFTNHDIRYFSLALNNFTFKNYLKTFTPLQSYTIKKFARNKDFTFKLKIIMTINILDNSTFQDADGRLWFMGSAFLDFIGSEKKNSKIPFVMVKQGLADYKIIFGKTFFSKKSKKDE